jgi:hypothetical protein
VSELLDELARTLATPMSRSRTLRVLGGALVAAATPTVLKGAPAARAGRRATLICGCGYRPTTFSCPDPGENDPTPGQPCGPPVSGIPQCCDGGKKCCSDGPPGGNFPGRCTWNSQVSREGYYCCAPGCVCHKGTCCPPGSERLFDKTGYPICCERGETLCDHPQAQGGVVCCKKRCGPDITEALQDALSRTKSAFSGWSNLQRYDACIGLVTLPAAAISWDIRELGPGGRKEFSKRYGGCDGCGYSVQVGKDCHYSGSVNYVAYGVMMRLCHDHLSRESSVIADWFSREEMLELIYIHKSLNWNLTQGANFKASSEWANAGYQTGSVRPTPPGDRPECKERCSKEYSGGGLTVNWLPDVIRPN